MTSKQFCDIYNSFTGESGMMSTINNPKQLAIHCFTGEELKEYTEHVISFPNTQNSTYQLSTENKYIRRLLMIFLMPITIILSIIAGLIVSFRKIREWCQDMWKGL